MEFPRVCRQHSQIRPLYICAYLLKLIFFLNNIVELIALYRGPH